MLKKVVAFVDGENLVLRYQDTLGSGRQPRSEVVHQKDRFVWSPDVTLWTEMDLVRINYYAMVVGDTNAVEGVEREISNTAFLTRSAGYEGRAKIIPRVHKKPKSSNASRVVDIEMTMDIMRAALEMPIDGIYLLTGDGDFLPLVREITRSSSKQVYLGAFSCGLSKPLRDHVEAFIDLDPMFFMAAGP